MNDQDRDVPRVNANDINPQEITDALLKMSMQIPEPIYDQNTIKSDTYENFYAGEFIEGSGDADEDNDVAAYMDETVNQALVHAQDLEQRDQEANERGLQEGDEPAITSDLQFQQAGTGAQNITPETGQVKSEDVAALFPDDATTIAAARRRESA
jgi:hypothetical protein